MAPARRRLLQHARPSGDQLPPCRHVDPYLEPIDSASIASSGEKNATTKPDLSQQQSDNDVINYYYPKYQGYESEVQDGQGPPSPFEAVRTSGTLVRAEELGIVIVVLLLWVAAIALFINRWGKIRLMEPYQPYFEPEATAASTDPSHPHTHRPSFFDAPRNSLSLLPGAAQAAGGRTVSPDQLFMKRRSSNLSALLPPPTLGLPLSHHRRLSSYIPQRRASYFVSPSRRASYLGLCPPPGPTESASPSLRGGSHTGRSALGSHLQLSSTGPGSRRTSVCTAAEYLMKSSRAGSAAAGLALSFEPSSRRSSFCAFTRSSSPTNDDTAQSGLNKAKRANSSSHFLTTVELPKLRYTQPSPDSTTGQPVLPGTTVRRGRLVKSGRTEELSLSIEEPLTPQETDDLLAKPMPEEAAAPAEQKVEIVVEGRKRKIGVAGLGCSVNAEDDSGSEELLGSPAPTTLEANGGITCSSKTSDV